MIKLYIDWNVIVGMKQGYFPELVAITEHKGQFFINYSTSHISDILVSFDGSEERNRLIEDDLKYISKLTDNYCASIQGQAALIDKRNPTEIFEEQVELKRSLNREGLFDSILGTIGLGSEASELLTGYLALPLPIVVKEALDNPDAANHFKQFYPDLNSNSTLGDLINSGWKHLKSLNETDAYGELRKNLQSGIGIKPNQLYNDKAPFSRIDQLHEKLEKLTGVTIGNPSLDRKYAPEWFNQITELYLKLDMYGYQQDKIKVDEKNKDTMRNTIDDGFHAAFASMSDFYITNDKRSLNKTREVYKQMGINTKVFTPVEFVSYYNSYLVYQALFQHLVLWTHIAMIVKYAVAQEEFGVMLTYQLPLFLFDYFNRLYVIDWSNRPETSYMLTREKPTNNKNVYAIEVIALINKINSLFMMDVEALSENDINLNTWEGCSWQDKEALYSLVLVNGYLQFYLDLPSNQ